MSRDQRTSDNWALLHAQSHALERRAPLVVLFCLAPRFSDATLVHYGFMLENLKSVEVELLKLNIPFLLVEGIAEDVVPRTVREFGVGTVITDFSPLRAAQAAKRTLLSSMSARFIEVDAHNIVPAWHVSPKLEFAARTLRPKLHRLLPDFLDDFPALKRHPYSLPQPVPRIDWEKASASVRADQGPAIFDGFPAWAQECTIAPGSSVLFSE
jgi:deoxyribodipyrimidine photo-lyase